jgi:hypothetical protein
MEPERQEKKAAGSARANVSDFAAFSQQEIWRRLQESDQRAVIGLKAPDQERGIVNDEVLIDAAQLSKARAELFAHEDVEVLKVDHERPAVTVRFKSPEVLESVRRKGQYRLCRAHIAVPQSGEGRRFRLHRH